MSTVPAHTTVLATDTIAEANTSEENRLTCGHFPTPVEKNSIGTGYAIVSVEPWNAICLNCADTSAREEMKNSDKTFAYVSTDTRHVTTWSGGQLGTITSSHVSNWQFTPTGGQYRTLFVQVTDVHGNRWHGRGPADEGSYVSLRRAKA